MLWTGRNLRIEGSHTALHGLLTVVAKFVFIQDSTLALGSDVRNPYTSNRLSSRFECLIQIVP